MWSVPAGRILHGYGRVSQDLGGTGGTVNYLEEWENETGSHRRPAVLKTWASVPGVPGREQDTIDHVATIAAKCGAEGRVLCLWLNFGVGDYTGFGQSPDDEIAAGTHDAFLQQVIDAAAGCDAYISIGGETNGPWRGHWTDGTFLEAYEHVASMVRSSLPRARLVWAVETSGTVAWDTLHLLPSSEWIDVYGIDLYSQPSHLDDVSRALFALAISRGRRVLIGESAPWGWTDPSQSLADRINGWFVPTLAHAAVYPGVIEGWIWTPDDYTTQGHGDCRFHLGEITGWGTMPATLRQLLEMTAFNQSFLNYPEWKEIEQ